MFVALAEGRLKLSEAPARVVEFVKLYRYRLRVFGDAFRSLDMTVGEDGLRFGDQFTQGLWQ